MYGFFLIIVCRRKIVFRDENPLNSSFYFMKTSWKEQKREKKISLHEFRVSNVICYVPDVREAWLNMP